jgi:DNA-binding NarL/FixJ family response regulator
VKIIVADDHAMYRDGLRHALELLASNITLIEAADYPALLAAAADHPDADLVLVDLNMPGAEPFSTLRSLLSHHPTLPLVVLSASEKANDMRQALEIGAMGFIPKREDPGIMLSALRLVLSGGVYIPPSLLHGYAHSSPRNDSLTSLTPRQLDVLRELVTGTANKEIGRRLDMAEATVKAHVTAIFRALNVSNRTQAAGAAERLGMLPSSR